MEDEFIEPTIKPGDHCYYVRGEDGRLYTKHVDCHEHADGVITDCVTLEIVTDLVCPLSNTN